VVRNPQVHSQTARLPVTRVDEAPSGCVLVDIVVLSGDLALFEAIRHAVGERNPVWRARSAEESVDLLLTGRCGVLLVDMGAVSAQPASLIQQIVEQFPDVVIVVAGRRDDESVLANLISDGLVYRFMHKPLTPKRAGMFVSAAIRSHVERRGGRVAEPLLPIVKELRSRLGPRRWLLATVGLALLLALIAVVLMPRQSGRPAETDRTPVVTPAPATGPLADPVLSRARAALAAGRYEAPPGRNALDLFAAVLLARPDDAEARAGLRATVDALLAAADRATAAGDTDEARRISKRVLAVEPGNAAARALLARLETPAEPPARTSAPMPQSRSQPVPSDRVRPAPAAAPAPAQATPVLRTPVSPAPDRGRSAPPRREEDRALPLRGPVSLPSVPTGGPTSATPVRLSPDPLAPRFVNAPPPTGITTAAVATQRGSAIIERGPPAPRHAIAGYVNDVQQRTPAAPVREEIPTGIANRALEPLSTVEPVYPADAFRNRIEGWVEVEFTVSEQGTVRDVYVVEANPRGIFEPAASQAVSAWRYRPRVVNGQPVPQRTSVTLRFNVDD
jgi:TonB family protein